MGIAAVAQPTVALSLECFTPAGLLATYGFVASSCDHHAVLSSAIYFCGDSTAQLYPTFRQTKPPAFSRSVPRCAALKFRVGLPRA